MNSIAIFQIIFAIFITVHNIDGSITHGVGTNYTKLMRKIWLKANHLMPNYLPDTTFNDYYRLRVPGGDALSGRRIIRELIAAQDKREQNKANQKFETDYDKYVNFIRETQPNVEIATANDLKVTPGPGMPNDVASGPYNKEVVVYETKETQDDESSKEFNNDYDKILESVKRPEPTEESRLSKATKNLKGMGINALRAIGRRDTIKAMPTHRLKAAEKRMMQNHADKIEQIADFLRTHHETTKYVYEEIKRIAEKRVIKDDLRLMVDVLEQRGMENVKKEVLKCFYKSKKEEKHGAIDYWSKYTPNNLIIKTMLD